MDITAIIGIGIIGAILAVTVKSYRPEISVCISVCVGILIFQKAAESLKSVIEEIQKICESSGVNTDFFKAAIKVIAIAYITQFASEIAKDSGEGAISKKLEFAGKTAVLTVMLPVIKNLLDVIINALMSF